MSEIPPGGGPGGYYNQGDYPRPPAPASGKGTLILVLGILSLVVCGLLGPVAWIMGNNATTEIRAGRMDPNEQGLVTAGKICGMIATILVLLICGFYILILALGIGIAGFSGVR